MQDTWFSRTIQTKFFRNGTRRIDLITCQHHNANASLASGFERSRDFSTGWVAHTDKPKKAITISNISNINFSFFLMVQAFFCQCQYAQASFCHCFVGSKKCFSSSFIKRQNIIAVRRILRANIEYCRWPAFQCNQPRTFFSLMERQHSFGHSSKGNFAELWIVQASLPNIHTCFVRRQQQRSFSRIAHSLRFVCFLMIE